MKRRKVIVVEALTEQAVVALRSGNRFQVRHDAIGDDDDLRRMLNRLAVICGANIRANSFQGLLTFYNDDSDYGTSVTVAMIE